MLTEMILSDIEALNAMITLANDTQNSNAFKCILDNYGKIYDQCINNAFLNHTLVEKRDLLSRSEAMGIGNVYTYMQTILNQVGGKATILQNQRNETYITPYFSEIRKHIIQAIRGARYFIWIAVAWFTDNEIYSELLAKKNEGINVQVLTLDIDGNKDRYGNFVLSFKGQIEAHYFKDYKKGKENLHHKFCVIDSEHVITGSYNWSNGAVKNMEDVIFIHDSETAKQYMEQYISIKRISI